MSMVVNRSSNDAASRFLESMRPTYAERGYDFIVHPLRTQLPDFLAAMVPDAVAMRRGDNIAIKLLTPNPSGGRASIIELRELIKDHPDWSLAVAHMGKDSTEDQKMPVVGKDTILRRADEAEFLAEEGHEAAAFILGWSLLEASLNSLHPDADKRPRPPGTVIQALSMSGDIDYESEKALRPLAELRNRIVHGDIDAVPSTDDVRQVLMAVRTALSEPATDVAS